MEMAEMVAEMVQVEMMVMAVTKTVILKRMKE
jgi:hypothetical protein